MTDRHTLFANVVLPVPIHQEFTYRVTHEHSETVRPGLRVVVPFGKSKLLTGIITEVHERVPKEHLARYIEYILDDQPIVTKKQYAFWQWIAGYYMSPIGDVLNAALPANFKLASETRIVLHPDLDHGKFQLTEKQEKIIDVLEVRDSLDLKEISEILGIKTIQPIVKEMIDKRMIISLEALNERFSPKTKLMIQLHKDLSNDDALQDAIIRLEKRKGAEKQLDAFLKILQLGQYHNDVLSLVEKKSILENGVSASTLQSLVKNCCIEIHRVETGRIALKGTGENEFKVLSEAQNKCLK